MSEIREKMTAMACLLPIACDYVLPYYDECARAVGFLKRSGCYYSSVLFSSLMSQCTI